MSWGCSVGEQSGQEVPRGERLQLVRTPQDCSRRGPLGEGLKMLLSWAPQALGPGIC